MRNLVKYIPNKKLYTLSVQGVFEKIHYRVYGSHCRPTTKQIVVLAFTQ